MPDEEIEVFINWGDAPRLIGKCRPEVFGRRGWLCENRHLDPDTGGEFVNDPWRKVGEICGRPRARQEG